MKKLFALVLCLCMLLTAAAFAEDQKPFTVRNGVTFGMTLDQVTATETVRYHDLDREDTRGKVTFTELEYENVTENGVRCDVTYLFVEDALAAVKINYETRDIGYDQVKAALTALYGEAAPLDPAALGNGIYAVDDDGKPERQAEAWTSGSVMIVLELDEDEIDLTYVDLAASYIGG